MDIIDLPVDVSPDFYFGELKAPCSCRCFGQYFELSCVLFRDSMRSEFCVSFMAKYADLSKVRVSWHQGATGNSTLLDFNSAL